jgi:hypothetical protein
MTLHNYLEIFHRFGHLGGGFSGFCGGLSLSHVLMSFVEVDRGFWLHPTSILDVYKVFWHLDMLWTGICVHPYTVTPVQVGGGFLGCLGRPEPVWCCNVMVEAQTPHEVHSASIWYVCIVFNHLDMLCIWAYGSPLTVLGLWRSGVRGRFSVFLGRAEPVWCYNVIVEAQTPCGMQSTSIWYVYKVF